MLEHPDITAMNRYGELPREIFPQTRIAPIELPGHDQHMRDFNDRMAAKCQEEAKQRKEQKQNELPHAG